MPVRLPVGQAPVLGRNLTDIFEYLRLLRGSLYTWNGTIAATGTTYIGSEGNDSTTELEHQVLMPRAATIRNFCVRHLVAGTRARRVVYTLQINGEPTAAVLSLNGTDTYALVSSVSVPVASLDLVSVKITRPDGSIATAPSRVACSWEVL